jgi:hypothetical protein
VVEVAVINVYFVVGVVGGIDQIARRGLLVIAKALYEAPESGLLTAMMALGFDCGAQPLIVPSSLANTKIEGHPCTLNSDDPLKTIPVDEPLAPFFAAGTTTSSGRATPQPL